MVKKRILLLTVTVVPLLVFSVSVYPKVHFGIISAVKEKINELIKIPPIAYIDSISPSPAIQGEVVSFSGHGKDIDGTVVGYSWRSNINGILSASSSFGTSSLSVGIHTIYFKVQDNDGAWSKEDTETLIVNSVAFASNQSTSTLCAEEDNINIPLSGDVASFVIEATHPTYEVGTDNCEPDFSNCPPPEPGYPFTPGVYKLFDDGETVLEAVREAEWWRPNGMEVSVDTGTPVTDIHYVRIYRKIADANEWPQYFVLYMDGNMKLIPHPPVGISSVCFGSSVMIGPAPIASRPIAEITSVRYISASKTMEVIYQTGGSAILNLQEVSRNRACVGVTVNYPTDIMPFATFRSMFVVDSNADVDHVKWRDTSDVSRDDPIMTFSGGKGTEWFFYRRTWSQHNTSAPDIRIRLQ